MKTCPYCAEQIQDDAIKCRYCGSMLVAGMPEPAAPAAATFPPAPSASAAASARPEDEPLQFSHSGQRYLLGYGSTFFGIWDRMMPGAPVRRFPRTDDGWREAWLAYVAMEPHHAEVGIGGSVGAPTPAGSTPAGSWGAARPASRPVNGAWWLLPILLGWLGGLVAWLVNKDNDQRTARAMLLLGIGISILGAVLVALTWNTTT